MRIVTHNSKDEISVYIQVKDLLYLGRVTKRNDLVNEYINLLNSKKKDNDFIKVSGELEKVVLSRVDIVDFKEMYKESIDFLIRALVNTCITSFNADESKQRSDAIRDIINFKKGELDYGIPVLSDGDIFFESDNGLFIFSSTIIDDCFTLRTVDYSDISGVDYQEFLSTCINKVREKYGEDSENYSISQIDSMIVVKLGKKKDKNSKISSLIKKIRGEH